MPAHRRLFVVAATAATLLIAAAGARASGQTVLTATDTGSTYAPTFTGNGVLGVRVPPDGQGYAAGTVPAQSELAGFYAQPSGQVQQRANIPTWSTLQFGDGGTTFSLGAGHTSGWRQSIDLHTGIVTTSATWTAPDGHRTRLRYQVLTDRAQPHVGLVRLEVTPQWSGTATVTDLIDGTPATLTTQLAKGWDTSANTDWVTVKTEGTGIEAAIASRLRAGDDVHATTAEADQSRDQSVGQRLTFPMSAGTTYTFTKYVGVESSPTSDPTAPAKADAASAASVGWSGLVAANDAAWAKLWKGRIDVLGDPTLATDVNASEFYLWSSTTQGVDWSISPAGLSSNGYNGHIFWDAETWMYPSLLAQHPDIAAGINAYRFQRLSAAEQHATATGYQGARYPWESALDGTEQIPPPVSVNSEGLYEQHITADIALAQWQYYLATGDRNWLASQGWPVLSKAAEFWASRVTAGPDGSYHIDHVTGPDEENPDVNDEAYTNVAAKTTLIDATRAAQALGFSAPASWSQIASKIVVPVDSTQNIHPEFDGYQGQLVKQADVTLLQYPWNYPMPPSIATIDLNYYTVRSDPGGPSMTDSVGNIDAAALGTPGCSSFVFTERSYQPFIRDVFDQFSETRTGGAFTFMTGIGGFLQEFLYGYSGMRWSDQGVELNPSLTGQLRGVVLRNLQWRGRTFTVEVGRRTTEVSLTSGPALPVITPSGTRTVPSGGTLTLSTRRPDLQPTRDRVRCQPATANSTTIGTQPLAAVDGSPATDWQPSSLPATLTVPLAGRHPKVATATLVWGRQWPPAPGPNIPPPPTPVTVLRATDYTVQISQNGRVWRTVAAVSGRTTGTTDVLHFKARRARYVRAHITAATAGKMPMLEELTLTR
ncbi:MAG TPA: discoidin domain-containing protein [Solirubrobacteraceae bacterium]|jgi:trehalose/maltose hydrolase-like predicted phosphorylase